MAILKPNEIFLPRQLLHKFVKQAVTQVVSKREKGNQKA